LKSALEGQAILQILLAIQPKRASSSVGSRIVQNFASKSNTRINGFDVGRQDSNLRTKKQMPVASQTAWFRPARLVHRSMLS
jgi:hypothetical protein